MRELRFYERCFGGKILTMFPYGDTPMAEQVPSEWRAKILHATLTVGDNVLMGADVAPEQYRQPRGFHVVIHQDETGEAERIYRTLAEKGTQEMPLQKTFWAERFGVVVDEYGISWEINCTPPGDRPTPSDRIEVIPAAPDQEPILANLLELYAHDFSEFHDIGLAEDGRFGYPPLASYWLEPNRYPFLIRVDGWKTGGIGLSAERGAAISSHATMWDVAEFFVVRRYRGHGTGTYVAHQIWRRFPGSWEVRVMESNRSAYQFWKRAIAEFVGETNRLHSIEKNADYWRVFAFESRSLRI